MYKDCLLLHFLAVVMVVIRSSHVEIEFGINSKAKHIHVH